MRLLVKPEMAEEFEREVSKWMVTNPDDRRTPGLFKLEFIGDKFVALCSKTYNTTNLEVFRSCFTGCASLGELKEKEFKRSSKVRILRYVPNFCNHQFTKLLPIC